MDTHEPNYVVSKPINVMTLSLQVVCMRVSVLELSIVGGEDNDNDRSSMFLSENV